MEKRIGLYILAGLTIISTAAIVCMDIATQRLINSMAPDQSNADSTGEWSFGEEL